MGEEELKAETEVKEPEMNGTKTAETVAEKKGDDAGVKEMEEDKKDENDETAEEKTEDNVKEKDEAKKENKPEVVEEPKSEAMEEEKNLDGNDSNEKQEAKEKKIEELDVKMDDVADVEDAKVKEAEKIKESEEANKDEVEIGDEEKKDKKEKKKGKRKGSKKRIRAKSDGTKSTERKKRVVEKVVEPRTPAIVRPVRERKSVERLVATVDKDTSREIQIEKGQGTPLKDIPNVAFKLARKRNEETFKLLHNIIYGRRGKAAQVKQNISRFSGFVWHENEEKQKLKIKEKFDKFIKEKLLEFCDVLDIPITKTTSKKEEVLATLLEFLEAPRATTTVLLSEQEGRKRKRPSPATKAASGSSKGSAKTSKKTGDTSEKGEKANGTDDESEEEEKENGLAENSEDEKSEQSESEEKKDEPEHDSEEETAKEKSSAGKSKKETKTKTLIVKCSGKAPTKIVMTPTRPRSIPKGTRKSSANRSKTDVSNDTASKVFSRKKKTEEPKIEKSPPSKKSNTKEKSGTKAVKRKEPTQPSDDELKNAITKLLKEVDFNTATFTDILKKLEKKYQSDLLPRKSSIKRMVQDELTKLADDDDEEDDEDTKQPAGKRVKT